MDAMKQEPEREFLAAQKSLVERGMAVFVVVPNERLTVWKEEGDTLEIHRQGNHWTVVRWDCVQGPGPDDFHVEYATLGRLQYRLANLVYVSQSAVDAIAEQRRLRARASPKKEPGVAYRAEVSQFLRRDHASGLPLRLMARRDLEEAYVVDAGNEADREERDETHE